VSFEQHVDAHGELPGMRRLDLPDVVLGQKELAGRIQAALDRLPFDQRTAVVLREIDGLSYDEIAYSLNVAVGTVKSRLARAREQLRGELRQA
jgi:RNA polymerase sigma-70 factor (ECF subfamily)